MGIDRSMILLSLAVLSILAAVVAMMLGYADIDRWWWNPLIWSGLALLYAGWRAAEQERTRDRARAAQWQKQFDALIRERLQQAKPK